MKRRVAFVIASFLLTILAAACGFGSDAPRVGDKGDFCSATGSIKADSNGKWECRPDDPRSQDSTKHWVKVG